MVIAWRGGQAPQLSAGKAIPDQCGPSCDPSTQTPSTAQGKGISHQDFRHQDFSHQDFSHQDWATAKELDSPNGRIAGLAFYGLVRPTNFQILQPQPSAT